MVLSDCLVFMGRFMLNQQYKYFKMFDEYVSTDDIHQYFVFKEVLGEGAFAEVRRAIYIEQNKPVAIKCIDKKRINEEDLKIFKNECQIMIYLDHPNIVQVYEVYDNADYFYIVMQYMEGGQLCDQKNLVRCKTEGQICQIVRTITDALDFCHSKNIVHRDMKPENILWSTNDHEAILKIADFGFAKISTDSLMTTACGTPMFFSPQILQRKPYSKSVDYWSLGVITYILLSGRSPFEAEDEDELFNRIKTGKVEFPEQFWKYISTSAKDFILKLLQKNPKYRYKADEIRRHPWINADHTQVVSYKERQENIWQFEAERKIEKLRKIINLTLIDMRNESQEMDSRLLNTYK